MLVRVVSECFFSRLSGYHLEHRFERKGKAALPTEYLVRGSKRGWGAVPKRPERSFITSRIRNRYRASHNLARRENPGIFTSALARYRAYPVCAAPLLVCIAPPSTNLQPSPLVGHLSATRLGESQAFSHCSGHFVKRNFREICL